MHHHAVFFFFNDSATTEIYTLSLHDALPISGGGVFGWLLSMLGQDVGFPVPEGGAGCLTDALLRRLSARGATVECGRPVTSRSEEHTSELQSRQYLVCRLLLEKKNEQIVHIH